MRFKFVVLALVLYFVFTDNKVLLAEQAGFYESEWLCIKRIKAITLSLCQVSFKHQSFTYLWSKHTC